MSVVELKGYWTGSMLVEGVGVLAGCTEGVCSQPGAAQSMSRVPAFTTGTIEPPRHRQTKVCEASYRVAGGRRCNWSGAAGAECCCHAR